MRPDLFNFAIIVIRALPILVFADIADTDIFLADMSTDIADTNIFLSKYFVKKYLHFDVLFFHLLA